MACTGWPAISIMRVRITRVSGLLPQELFQGLLLLQAARAGGDEDAGQSAQQCKAEVARSTLGPGCGWWGGWRGASRGSGRRRGRTAVVSSASERSIGAPGQDGSRARGANRLLGQEGQACYRLVPAPVRPVRHPDDPSRSRPVEVDGCSGEPRRQAVIGMPTKGCSLRQTAQAMRASLLARATAALLCPRRSWRWRAQARRRSGWSWSLAARRTERAPWMRSIRR